MVPTYFRRCSGIECFNGHRGFALLFLSMSLLPSVHFNIAVIPRESGVSSTPQPLDDERSGILDHPRSRMMTPNLTSRMSATSKAELRAAALERRDALSDEQRVAAALAVAKRGLPFEIKPGTVVSGYSPIRSEIDPTPLMLKIAAQGARLALPARDGARPVAEIPRLVARRSNGARAARHP